MPKLTWIGKDKVINHDRDVPFRVLTHNYGFLNGVQSDTDSNSGNKIIHGDNLEALKSLLPQYEGKIKCIYIDPPYNTGNEGWVYNDNVNDPKIKKWLHNVVGKEGEDLSRHDKWLCMMYPRLKLLHQLLAADGAIFISIDDNEQAHLRLVMDEIFGGNNFVRNIIWHKRYAASNDSKGIPDMHDFIIVYQKTLLFQRNLMPRTDKQDSLYKYDSKDGKGLWRPDNLSVKTYSSNYDYPIKNLKTGIEYNPPKGRSWMSNEEQIQKWIIENRIFFGKDSNGAPQLKRYLNEVQQGIVPISFWSYDDVNHTDGAKKELKSIFSNDNSPFQTPKPSRLIERILQIATNKNDLILDSFAGSGTTAHAVLNLNKADGGKRKFILIEMEDYAETITAERVKRVIKGYGKAESTEGGFDYYSLGERLFGDDQLLNPNVGVDIIRDYVWYSETRAPLSCFVPRNDNEDVTADNAAYLGQKDGTAYYFYYDTAAVTTLDDAFLETVRTAADAYVMYADRCTLSATQLDKYRIVFKKIPRDISRF